MSGIQSIYSPKWRDLKIRDILTLEYGKALQNYRNGNSYFDVFGTNGKIGVTEIYLHDEPSLIIGRKGAYRGVHLAKFPFFVIDTAFYTKNKLEDLDVGYLYYWFKCIDINSMDSGSAIPSTSRDEVYDLDILLPPIEEQKAIAFVLSSLDDKIDLLHRQNKTLEAMAETLFRQWFVVEATGDWEEKPLGELLTVTSSKRIFYSEYVTTGIPFYRSKEIIELHNTGNTKSELCITENRFHEIQEKFGIPIDSDILLTSVGTLGIPYRVKKNDKFYFKDGNLTWFKDFTVIPSIIIYCWLKSSIGKEHLDSITIGSTQAALTINGLKQIKLTIPPKERLEVLEENLIFFYNKIDANHIQIQTLETLRDTLLPKLMSGEVRVTV
ncbi:restriction endonuclease subunit S [Nitrosomonas sp.]|uniref:restriction endonuclease subunit S n=1 Tax=Nitrosomonas sp. TaxID=42353 RepID=UPI0025E4C8E2|nr:restriction endonuclease subunit S [Nitrosomonas sp.]